MRRRLCALRDSGSRSVVSERFLFLRLSRHLTHFRRVLERLMITSSVSVTKRRLISGGRWSFGVGSRSEKCKTLIVQMKGDPRLGQLAATGPGGATSAAQTTVMLQTHFEANGEQSDDLTWF